MKKNIFLSSFVFSFFLVIFFGYIYFYLENDNKAITKINNLVSAVASSLDVCQPPTNITPTGTITGTTTNLS